MLMVLSVFIFIVILASNIDLLLFIIYAVCICAILLPFMLFFIRKKYTMKENVLVVGRYLKNLNIDYSSIKGVDEIFDSSVGVLNYSLFVSKTRQVWITFADVEGKVESVCITPIKKDEFISQLKTRLPRSNVCIAGEMESNPNYQAFKTESKKFKYYFIVFVVVLAVILFIVRVLLRLK